MRPRAASPRLRAPNNSHADNCACVLLAAAQLQADTRETDIELVPDDSNIYRWVGFLKARAACAGGTPAFRALRRRLVASR